MKVFNYNVNLTGLTVIKTESQQHSMFFQDGHPKFLIPDFYPTADDIWQTFMEFLEKKMVMKFMIKTDLR